MCWRRPAIRQVLGRSCSGLGDAAVGRFGLGLGEGGGEGEQEETGSAAPSVNVLGRLKTSLGG